MHFLKSSDRSLGFICAIAMMCAFGLTACKTVSVDENGAVSPVVLTHLQQYVGIYSGKLILKDSLDMFADKVLNSRFSVLLSLQGNRPVLTPNADILGHGCGSKIGKLKMLDLDGGWDVTGTFKFDPGRCVSATSGREVLFSVDRDGEAQLVLLQRAMVRVRPQLIENFDFEAELHKLKKTGQN